MIMSQLMNWLSASWCEYGVYAMLHSLWQGTAIAAVLWMLLRAIPVRRCRLRYALSMGALLLVLVCIPATMAVLSVPATRQVQAMPIVPAASAASPAPAVTTLLSAGQPSAPAVPGEMPWVQIATVVWLVGFVGMLARLCLHVRGAARLAHRGRAVESPELLERLTGLRRRLKLKRPIRMLLVDDLLSPAVVGIFRPVIVIPAAIASGLPAQHLEAILLHELAHIRRNDYVLNLLQMLIEAVLFFNPAAWWISRCVRVEREASCDAMAANAIGQPVTFAQALEAVVSFMAGTGPQVGMGFADGSGSSPLDRVRRLLVPTYRPGLRLSGGAMAGVMFSGLAVLVGLWGTTQAVVAVAAEALTPQQRVERIEKLQKSYGTAQDIPAGRLTIDGEVITEEGQAVPGRYRAQVRTETLHSGIAADFDIIGGLLHGEVDSGNITIVADIPGYALGFVGPFVGKPGEAITDLQIVMHRGWMGRVQVLGESGQAIGDQELSVSMVPAKNVGGRSLKLRTDREGWLTIPDCGECPVTIEASIPGYQFDRTTLKLAKNVPAKWKLRQAKLQQGVVVAEQDGKPVVGVRVVLLSRKGFGDHQWHPRQDPPLLGVSDKQGRFSVDTMRDDCTYSLCFMAKGYTPKILYDVHLQEAPLKVTLVPGIHIRGRILAPAATLRKLLRSDNSDKLEMEYRDTIKISPDSSYGSGTNVPVTVKGDEARFELRDVFVGEFSFQVGELSKRLVVNENVDDLLFDLRPGAAVAGVTPKTRQVQIRLIPPKGAPLPQGSLTVSRFDPRGQEQYRSPVQVPLKDGVAVFETVVDKSIGYSSGPALAGYGVQEKGNMAVPAGEGPLVVEVPARPCGAVYGVAKAADGSPLKDFYASVVLMEKPMGSGDQIVRCPDGVNVQADAQGKYLLSPLPLGGKYAVVISIHNSAACVVSEVFAVTPQHPVIEINPQLVAGVVVRGRILSPDGQPVARATVSLRYSVGSPVGSYGTGPGDIKSDRDGTFAFTDVNCRFAGTVSLVVASVSDYQPWSGQISVDGKELVIRVEKGKAFRGRLIDNKTGKPVDNALVRIYTRDNRAGPMPETRSDAAGRFEFTTLYDAEYGVYMEDCAPPGTTWTVHPDGSYSTNGSGERPTFRPGDGEEKVYKVEVAPWKKN